MEIICLDTNVLIAHKRAKKTDKDKTFLFKLTKKPYQFAVSSITVYELLRGDNQDEDAYWKALFSNMTVLDFDSDCAEYAAKIYQDLKTKGLLIEAEDLLIAATSRRHQMKLATGNVKHFARVENLDLVVDNGLV
ncbi:type II toxin-antitoxin system VapC family toxin [Crenothrix polyspora]|uniref:PilT protein domain protein n=1 Tax=Crenothrix polyspora TaxID=360316 RepID=A0A1R4H0E0_9GAMM|nr:type II toxin-antitoxin system VapC family toxin [Crenothrix polyspora]SJM89723.1 PilT protein domain protein [Crenothrix polyspora]